MNEKNLSLNEWANEFHSFLSVEKRDPPEPISSRIIKRVQSDLNPSQWRVFTKLALIHFAVGFLVLLICPQFGIGLFEGMGLTALFMHFGDLVCSIVCGALFLGSSMFVSSLVLKPEEIRVIRKREIAQLVLLSLLSVFAFVSLGATVAITLGGAWVIGSVFGGYISLELGRRFRFRFSRLAESISL